METSTLEARIRTLEKKVSRQRCAILIILLVFFALDISAPLQLVGAVDKEIPDVLKAKAFHVVDDEGALFAELTVRRSAGTIVVYSAGETTQAAMGSGDEGGGYITCFNKMGDIQVNLGGDQDGGQVVTNDKTGTPRVVLSGDEKGGFVSTFDSEGTPKKLR